MSVHVDARADSVGAGVDDGDARVVEVGDVGGLPVDEVDVAGRHDLLDEPGDAERGGVDDVDHARIVDHDVSFSVVEDHRLGDVAEFHAVCAEENVVFDLAGFGVVVGERGVVPHEIPLASDEEAAPGAAESLFGLGSVLHAGPGEEREAPEYVSHRAFHRVMNRFWVTARIPCGRAACREAFGLASDPILRRVFGQTGDGRSSDSLPFRRLPVPWRGTVAKSAGTRHVTHSSGNCCRFSRHSLLIRGIRPDVVRNRCATKVRFFPRNTIRFRAKRLSL